MTPQITHLELPKQVSQVLRRLYEHSYNAYICGECVRSLIRGQTPFEYSVLTDAELSRVHAIFDEDSYKLELNADKDEIVVTVLGIALTIGSFHGSDLRTELAMKQAFTFNAIAYSAKGGDGFGVVDYWNGVDALSRNEIAFIEEEATFNPADILPALELYASGEFVVSDSANKLILTHYTRVVAAREEIEAVLMGKNARDTLCEYSDVFTTLIPELKMLETPQVSDVDLLGQSFRSVGLSSPVLTLRYALLLCELGKADCHSLDENGKPRYRGHLERARIYATRIMTRLGCAKRDIADTCDIISNAHHAAKAQTTNLADLRDEFSAVGLKLLVQFNIAVCRANFDEKAAMNYKKLMNLI